MNTINLDDVVAGNVAEYLKDWIQIAEVESYTKDKKQIFVAKHKNNDQLILTCERVEYRDGYGPDYCLTVPHITIVFHQNQKVYLISKDVLSEKSGQTTHSTGMVCGEDIETIWLALMQRSKED